MPHSLLIIEQGFLKPRRGKPVHGVEIFRLNLARSLIERGVRVSIVAERSWTARIASWFERTAPTVPPPEVIASPALLGVPGAGLIGTARAGRRRRRWDTVMYGNARLGLIPAMHWSQWAEMGRRYLLFAHREPGANFLDAVSTLRFDVVANSEWVARNYRGQVSGRVGVMYGVANADRFYPRNDAGAAARADGLVHFCLLGRLPSISKGMEAALDALRAIPPAVRARCRLHLASFSDPPDFRDPGVVAHRWMPAESVGDFLRTMDAMLTVSTHETFSQAIVQGMLTGLPVVASELPVYVEKLDPLGPPPAHGGPEPRRGGFLARGVQEIADAMILLARDEALRRRMGEEGRRTALERYVWDTDRFIRDYLADG